MYKIKQTKHFTRWLDGLKDSPTRIKLARRLEKASSGNLGDVGSVGKNVCEMREHFGPGWRMYYIVREKEIIVMLGGGDKSTQQRDIDKAILLSQKLED